jgi:hypothetical protein
VKKKRLLFWEVQKWGEMRGNTTQNVEFSFNISIPLLGIDRLMYQ